MKELQDRFIRGLFELVLRKSGFSFFSIRFFSFSTKDLDIKKTNHLVLALSKKTKNKELCTA